MVVVSSPFSLAVPFTDLAPNEVLGQLDCLEANLPRGRSTQTIKTPLPQTLEITVCSLMLP